MKRKPYPDEYPTAKPSTWRCGECRFIFRDGHDSKMLKHEQVTGHIWYTRIAGGLRRA